MHWSQTERESWSPDFTSRQPGHPFSEVAKEKRERKARPLDDPIVVVEQDESDEDQFEGPPGVLFVRRKRAKKPEPPVAQTISPEMQLLYASMFGSRSF